ncbi:MAG: hypothetical protein R2851_23395 [Caldilineaceae bacterium]
MWVDYDGELRAHQYGQGTQKDCNLRANPHVAISVLDLTTCTAIWVSRAKSWR